VSNENGRHPKHRIMNYHKFFVDNIDEGEKVLDIGCGRGFLLHNIALKSKTKCVGVDISEENVMHAKESLMDFCNAEVICIDIFKFDSKDEFDVVVLSNVLEHIDNRVSLLRHIISAFKPKKILVRVPVFEREWLVPYKKELGVEWRLDSTRCIEYSSNEFKHEIFQADLKLKSIEFK
jgi:2-polyprenyl-3-methyl-5-hydroxy-6-metoxy-1,4-benzoquinol methylase